MCWTPLVFVRNGNPAVLVLSALTPLYAGAGNPTAAVESDTLVLIGTGDMMSEQDELFFFFG